MFQCSPPRSRWEIGIGGLDTRSNDSFAAEAARPLIDTVSVALGTEYIGFYLASTRK